MLLPSISCRILVASQIRVDDLNVAWRRRDPVDASHRMVLSVL